MFTTIIAIWGAITGSISLVMKYLDFRKTKPRLKIELSETYKSFIVPGDYLDVRGTNYGSEWYSAAISLKIENNSRQPVTVNKIEYKYTYGEKSVRWNDVQFTPFSLKSFTKSDGLVLTRLRLPLAKSIELPVRIEAYDAISFEFFAPFIDEKLIQNGHFKINLKIHTPAKEHHVTFSVPEIHQIVPNLDTYIRQK